MTSLSSRCLSTLCTWRNPQGKEENWLDQLDQPRQTMRDHVVILLKKAVMEVGTAFIVCASIIEVAVAFIFLTLGACLNARSSRFCNIARLSIESSAKTFIWGARALAWNLEYQNIPTSEALGFESAKARSERYYLDIKSHYSDNLLKLRIQEGIDLRFTDIEQAISQRRPLSLIKLLLEKGAALNSSSHTYDRNGRITSITSPLSQALQLGLSVDIIRLLLEKGADANKLSHNYGPNGRITSTTSPLSQALQGGLSLDIIRLLLEKGANVNETMSASGPDGQISSITTPLSQALQLGLPLNVIRLLLEKGANINRPSYTYGPDRQCTSSTPPLFKALERGHSLEVIRLLLDHGAIPTRQNHQGISSFDYAIANNLPLATVFLLFKKSGDLPASRLFQPDTPLSTVREYLQLGLNPLLLLPCLENFPSVGFIKLLFEFDLHPNKLIHEAAECCDLDPLEFVLRQPDVNLEFQDNKGDTPLFNALHSLSNTQAFLERKVNVNAQNNVGNTPLIIAFLSGAPSEVIELLLRSGANPNISNRKGETYHSLKANPKSASSSSSSSASSQEDRAPYQFLKRKLRLPFLPNRATPLYQICGLAANSDSRTIRRRINKLSPKIHPDQMPSEAEKVIATEAIKIINRLKDALPNE